MSRGVQGSSARSAGRAGEKAPEPRPFRDESPDNEACTMEAAVVDGTVRRFSVDGQDTIGYPIVPVGDTTRFTPNEDGLGAVDFPSIGFQIVYPSPQGKLPSSAILDVYAGLMFMYQNAGFPDDGRVYFSRYQLLHLIGWLSTAKDDQGKRTVKPSGRHYKQLKRALLYLEGTRFVWDDPTVLQFGPDGERFRGMQGFPILQYARVVEDPTGPRGETTSRPARSMVQFSEPFVKLLGGGERTTRLDFDLFLSLPSGTPRVLYRTLLGMANQGRRSIRLEELFQRVGSTQTHFVPARARQILGKAHKELRSRGVLEFEGKEPDYVKMNGEHWVRYAFGNPADLISSEGLLVSQAMAYGLKGPIARELAVAHRQQLERVLAAVTLGMLTPKKSLPGMIRHYTERGHEISAPNGNELAQISLDLQAPEMAYVAWTAAERKRRLKETPGIDLDRIRLEIDEQPTDGDLPRPDWVVEGLVAMELNERLHIPPLHIYLQTEAAS